MKKVLTGLFLILFSFQLAVKTGVVTYYALINDETALENCQYKTITICKGNCYVVKQIKLISSDHNKDNKAPEDFDLNKIADVVFEVPSSPISCLFAEQVSFYSFTSNDYSFISENTLLKPPMG